MVPTDVLQELQAYLQATSTATLIQEVFLSLVVVIGMLAVRYALRRFVASRTKDAGLRYRWYKVIGYLTWILLALLIVIIWLDGFGNMATIIAIIGAGLAIALRDPIVDLGGWLYITWRRPLQVGQRVGIDGVRGDVVDIGPFVFSLMEVGDGISGPRQSTGRIVQVPNAYIFTHKLVNENLAFEFVWHEIPVVVTFESDWQRAKFMLEEIVHRHAGEFAPAAEMQLSKSTDKYMLKAGALEPTIYTRAVDIGVELTMRFLCGVRQPRVLEHVIWEDVLIAFASEPTIDFAYPTTRFYDNRTEGKPGAGGVVNSEQ